MVVDLGDEPLFCLHNEHRVMWFKVQSLYLSITILIYIAGEYEFCVVWVTFSKNAVATIMWHLLYIALFWFIEQCI